MTRLDDEYRAALAEFLDGGSEAALNRSYELGRAAIADGIGVIEIAVTHHYALAALLGAEDLPRQLSRAAEFFAECLSSFEMSLRGYQDANEQLVKANQELVARGDQLLAASRAKSDFLAMMSHELRTPLNSIIGFSEVLLDAKFGSLNERQVRYVNNVHGSGRHLLTLINELLDLSKIEAGRLEVTLRPISPRLLAAEAIAALQPLAAAKKIDVQFAQVGDTTVPTVYADELRYKQVLYNLLSNAIKFTPERGRVTVSMTSTGTLLRTTVSDSGSGIPPESLPQLFQPFSQLANARRPGVTGTGLGLALSRRLVELMGGAIGVESPPGSGATFFFDLPIHRADDQALPLAEGRVALIVDDDAPSRELLELTVRSAGLVPVSVGSGEAALQEARRQRPVVIILDVFLPRSDGWEVLRALKTDRETSSIPVVLATVASDRKKGISLGAVEHLVKPIDRAALLETLRRHSFTDRVTQGGVRVLAIDDDPRHLDLIRAALEPAGFHVTTASTGQEGLAAAKAHSFDLLLLDLVLPDLSGVEVIRALRTDGRSGDLPILLVTSQHLSAAERDRIRNDVLGIYAKSDLELGELADEIRAASHKR